MSFSNYKKVYFLGIGGIGMSALARYFNHLGLEVFGYDKTATDLTRKLEEEGILIHFSDNGEKTITTHHLTPLDTLIIITPAIPKDFEELEALNNHHFTIKKRSEILGMISENYTTIAVAGTHGKTTTSSLIAHLIYSSGKNCLAFLGGISTNYHTNLLLPLNSLTEAVCVVEADEYDRSFLKLSPSISIINSMDADHLDIYGTEEEFKKGFNDFAKKTRAGGSLFFKKDLPLNRNEINNYSFSLLDQTAQIFADNLAIRDGQYYFDYTNNISDIHFENLESGIPGSHNVENALAAISAALLIGLTEQQIRQGLKSFKGVRRRFEFIINHPQKIFIDDYAHHPEELRAFISSVKALYPNKKITGVFQPHLFTRTRDFVDGFAQSLNLLDDLILLDIYPAREMPIEGIDSSIIYDKITIQKTLCSKKELVKIIAEKNPEVLVTLGAGDIDTLVQPLKKMLLQKSASLFAEDLQSCIEGKVIAHEPMLKHTWLKIGGTADMFVKPKNIDDVIITVNYALEHQIPYFILGNGSNLLVGDGGIRGIVIALAEAESYFTQEGNFFTVSASYSLPKFVLETLKLGYEGLEATAGVPATIGGATRMNAGAYGTEVFDCIHKVKFIRDGVVQEKQKKDIKFSYRYTEFEHDTILETTFELVKADDINSVAAKRKALLEKRKDSQPLDKPNTGSVFKNPLPHFAGKLIEDAGLKGFALGNVQVSPKHANFIVNNGGATAKEFMELIFLIIRTVQEKYDILLHPEVLEVGEPNTNNDTHEI